MHGEGKQSSETNSDPLPALPLFREPTPPPARDLAGDDLLAAPPPLEPPPPEPSRLVCLIWVLRRGGLD